MSSKFVFCSLRVSLHANSFPRFHSFPYPQTFSRHHFSPFFLPFSFPFCFPFSPPSLFAPSSSFILYFHLTLPVAPELTMARYVCPPWFECELCPLGMPISLSTMLRHRRTANAKRKALGLTAFKWGPRVPSGILHYEFISKPSLKEYDPAATYPTAEQNSLISRELPIVETSNETLDVEVQPISVGMNVVSRGALQIDSLQNTSNATSQYGDYLSSGDAFPLYDDPLSTSLMSGSWSAQARSAMPLNSPELSSWVENNIGVFQIYYRRAPTHALMNDILKLEKCPSSSWKHLLNYVNGLSGVGDAIKSFPVCPGHFCFPRGDPDLLCPICKRANPGVKSKLPTFKYIPLWIRIRKIYEYESSRALFASYLDNISKGQGLYRDVFDGSLIKDIIERNGGWENVKNDVFLSISTDRFQAFRNRNCDVWPLLAIVLNLSPKVRYRVQNVLPLGFVPCKSEPKRPPVLSATTYRRSPFY